VSDFYKLGVGSLMWAGENEDHNWMFAFETISWSLDVSNTYKDYCVLVKSLFCFPRSSQDFSGGCPCLVMLIFIQFSTIYVLFVDALAFLRIVKMVIIFAIYVVHQCCSITHFHLGGGRFLVAVSRTNQFPILFSCKLKSTSYWFCSSFVQLSLSGCGQMSQPCRI